MEDVGTVLIAGASGVVGHAAATRFTAAGHKVLGLSRRTPALPAPGADYLALDLLDRDACMAAAEAHFANVTHIVYAAVNETPGDLIASWTDKEHSARNGRMIEYLLAPFERRKGRLRHVSIVHGTKAYGLMHYDRLPIPLRETLPRPPFDEFYFRQEDAAYAFEQKTGVPWTVLRAQLIAGGGAGGNLNGLLALAVYAALHRAKGQTLAMPIAAQKDKIFEITDAELLGDALVWAAQAPVARNRTFNVTNGDVASWPDIFQVVAEYFGLELESPSEVTIAGKINEMAAAWARLVAEQGLVAPSDVHEFLGESAVLSDFSMEGAKSCVTSTIAIRSAGFHTYLDSADCMRKWFDRWQAEKLLPRR